MTALPDLPPITLPAEFVIPAWRNAYLAGPIHIDVRPAVRVDADDLERLVRAYHEWLPNDPDIILALDLAEDVVTIFEHCRCGWSGGQGDHGSHVDYDVRQALAGRIEFP